MILSWRRRKANKVNLNISGGEEYGLAMEMGLEEIVIPSHFRCPISLDLMKDPVTLSTGMTYDRSSIDAWIVEKGHKSHNITCPVTNQKLTSFDQIPNHALRKMIQDWCVLNHSRGVERIPTPRIPVAAHDVSRVTQRVAAATRRGDYNKCLELVTKIRAWGKDSDRNKKCVAESNMGCCLSATFEVFSSGESLSLQEEILSVMTWTFPNSEEGQSRLGSTKSLRCLVRFLEGNKDLSSMQNAALLLRKLLSVDQKHVDAFVKEKGAIEALVKIIREGLHSHSVCPTATKASLSCLYYIISGAKEETKTRLVDLGLVSLLLEILVDAEKNLCERALGVLEGLCDSKQGRVKAYENALTMPLLVKKMLHVSSLANEFSVSIIWKLCSNQFVDDDNVEEAETVRIVIEALQAGAFQKLLVVLQVGCADGIKDKVTELLKVFNAHTSKLDCVDSSMNFKLKSPILIR